MISQQQQDTILQLLRPLKPLKVAVFGSYARNENHSNSDLDLLVQLDYSNKISLLDLAGVEQDLSDALGIPVDIVTEKSLSPHIRPFVERELRFILE